MEAIFNDRNNDTVSPDDFGLTARQVILADAKNEDLCEEYAAKLGITSLLERPFMQLSTGESRKVLFCQMLVSEPDLLILDEPFEGLDQASQRYWQQLMMEIRKKMTVVLIVNRFGDIPTCATHIALLDSLQLILQGKRADVEQQAVYSQLKFAEENMHASLPGSLSAKEKIEGNPFELENVTVQYGEQKIIDNLTWTVKPQQHWWIKGPNGAGKSTLLSIITGDHPQAYANKVKLFGRQRGTGETIWDIKKHIGYVSSQLHMDYCVNCSALEVIASGFFDSIGIYQRIPESVRMKAGDHPQAYANKVKLFGRQRGTGETIWDIKKHIGYVSSQLHMDYCVNCSALEVIASGFFDSIGIYQRIPESVRMKAMEWLARLNLQNLAQTPFRSLSWGQQRLLLIIRAMIKHPPILILDEPLQGLDGLNRHLVKQFIEQLVQNSETQLLFVSHQDSDAPNCLTHLLEFVSEIGYVYRQAELG